MAKTKKMKLVGRIPYYISNNGDGSASIRPCKTSEIADSYDDNQNEDGDGWGESCSGAIEIYEKDGKLLFEGITSLCNPEESYEYEEDYVELEQ